MDSTVVQVSSFGALLFYLDCSIFDQFIVLRIFVFLVFVLAPAVILDIFLPLFSYN